MPWSRWDDDCADHPKTLAAGNAAFGLVVRLTAWSNKQLTDGFIPVQVANLYGTRGEISKACHAGFLEPVTGGFQIHDYLDRNKTADQIRHERQQAADRQQRARDNATITRASQPSHGVTGASVTHSPSRPDPRATAGEQPPPPTGSPWTGGAVPSRRTDIAAAYAHIALQQATPRNPGSFDRAVRRRILADPELGRLAALFPTAPASVIAAALHGEKHSLGQYPRADELPTIDPDAPTAPVIDLRRTAP